MAIYHLSAQVISRKAGRSSTAASAYRAGEKIEDRRTGETFDFTRKGGVYGSGIVAPAGSPVWATDRSELWNQVELAERRKDAQVCREIDVALPVELDEQQRIEAVRAFVQSQFVDQGMIADVAFHDFDSHNPHAHIMLTMREIGPAGFGKKNRDWNQRELVTQWRQSWSEHANAALERAGVNARIDHRSYEAQGLEWEPTQHMGPAVAGMERRNPRCTRIGSENAEREERNLMRDLIAQDIEADQIWVDRTESEISLMEKERAALVIQIEAKSQRAHQERRKGEFLGGLRARMRPQMEKLAAFLDEFGLPGSEKIKERLRGSKGSSWVSEPIGHPDAYQNTEKADRDDLRAQEKPESDPLDFLDDDNDDPNTGPRPG